MTAFYYGIGWILMLGFLITLISYKGKYSHDAWKPGLLSILFFIAAELSK